jgi:chemotaxis protein methyltransferase CheR
MIEFRPMNLGERWPVLPASDLVLMPNVLIDFDVATKKQILGNVRKLMRPDGHLFLGGSETTLNFDPQFVQQEIGRIACYRLPAITRATWPPRRCLSVPWR